MTKITAVNALLQVAQGCGIVSAQITVPIRTPQLVPDNYLSSVGAKPKFGRQNKLTPDGNAATKQQRVRSVQHWIGSFTFNGQNFPYTMVGKDPRNGGITHVDTSLIPISF